MVTEWTTTAVACRWEMLRKAATAQAQLSQHWYWCRRTMPRNIQLRVRLGMLCKLATGCGDSAERCLHIARATAASGCPPEPSRLHLPDQMQTLWVPQLLADAANSRDGCKQ